MRISHKVYDDFLRAYDKWAPSGFSKVDKLARALQGRKGFNETIFHLYVQTRDAHLRDALVENNIPLALHFAGLKCDRVEGLINFDECVSQAFYKLLRCVEDYEPEKGKFSNFLGHCYLKKPLNDVGGAIAVPQYLFQNGVVRSEGEKESFQRLRQKAARAQNPSSVHRALNKDRLRRAIGQSEWENGNYSDKNGVEYLADTEAESPLDLLIKEEESRAVKTALNWLGRKGEFIKLRFGLTTPGVEFSVEDIRTAASCSKANIHALIKIGLRELRKMFSGFGLSENYSLELKHPKRVLVLQEYNVLRNYARMLDSIGGYPARFISDISELEAIADMDIGICIADPFLISKDSFKAVETIRRNAKFLPVVLTIPELPQEVRSMPGVYSVNPEDVTPDSHPENLEYAIQEFSGPSLRAIRTSTHVFDFLAQNKKLSPAKTRKKKRKIKNAAVS